MGFIDILKKENTSGADKYYFDFNGDNQLDEREVIHQGDSASNEVLLRAVDQRSKKLNDGCYSKSDESKLYSETPTQLRVFDSMDKYLNVGKGSVSHKDVINLRKMIRIDLENIYNQLAQEKLPKNHPYHHLREVTKKILDNLDQIKFEIGDFADVSNYAADDHDTLAIANIETKSLFINREVYQNYKKGMQLKKEDFNPHNQKVYSENVGQVNFFKESLSLILFHELAHVVTDDLYNEKDFRFPHEVVKEDGKTTCEVNHQEFSKTYPEVNIYKKGEDKVTRHYPLPIYFAKPGRNKEIIYDRFAANAVDYPYRLDSKEVCYDQKINETQAAYETYAYQVHSFYLAFKAGITSDDLSQWMEVRKSSPSEEVSQKAYQLRSRLRKFYPGNPRTIRQVLNFIDQSDPHSSYLHTMIEVNFFTEQTISHAFNFNPRFDIVDMIQNHLNPEHAFKTNSSCAKSPTPLYDR